MSATRNDFSTGEHQWHRADYVEWWIARDAGRDAERRRRIRDMLAGADLAPAAAISVLDVGGGYGVVSEEVLAAFPAARVTLQDYSEPMLAAARRRLAQHGERLRLVHADLREPSWTRAVGGPFDLAVSAIAIHNLRDLAAIAACYRGIAAVLKPGALFLDYDLYDIAGGLALHQKMLTEAGFARVDCLWQQSPAATLAAYKAEIGAAG
ncbi:MAG TPA: class I SAM-dependent methyltransferase [Stellaceae bacterium]|nr:class I SAM-dependent methyltransferase [Stellaceae bacterium]